jgi:uncharacterized membrane protein
MRLTHALWNVFLAVLPVLFAWGTVWALRQPNRSLRFWLGGLLVLAWLLFLPNTSYLLTGWRHFVTLEQQQDLFGEAREDRTGLLRALLVTACFVVYSGLGPLTFALSLRPVERWARERGLPVNLLAYPFFFLMSLGVYLGLVLRFNSWDVVNRLGDIFQASLEAVSRPVLMGMTIGFAVVLWVLYLATDIWLDGMVARWQRWTRSGVGAPGSGVGV